MPSSFFATFQSSAWAAEVASTTVKPHSTAIRCNEPIVLFLIVEVPFVEHITPPSFAPTSRSAEWLLRCCFRTPRGRPRRRNTPPAVPVGRKYGTGYPQKVAGNAAPPLCHWAYRESVN